MEPATATAGTMPPEIAAAVNAVMQKATGVKKGGHNQFHNYDFAKVEDLLATLQPAMVEAGLFIVQSEHDTTTLADGRLLKIQYAFRLAHKSGAVWSDPILHSGAAGVFTPNGKLDDKCVNKCHTGARKYFLLGLTQIPVGNMPDTDADDAPGNDAARNAKQQPPKPKTGDALRNQGAPPPEPERNAEPARGGYGRQKNNVDAVGAGPSGTVVEPAGAPTAKTLWKGIEHTDKQVGREGLSAIVDRIKQAAQNIAKGFSPASFPPEYQPANLEVAYKEWETWSRSVRAKFSEVEQENVRKALDVYSKAAKALDAALAKRRKADAAKDAGADPETGELPEYEQAGAA